MSRKMYTAIAAAMLLSIIFVSSMNTGAHADAGYITIQSNGNIVPNNGIIRTNDNVTYTMQRNTNMSIKVQRSNTMLNGNGTVLTSGGQMIGISVEATNVTIFNVTVIGFNQGDSSGIACNSYTIVYNCTIRDNSNDISVLGVHDSIIYNNQLECLNGGQTGVWIADSHNIQIAWNKFISYGASSMIIYSDDTFIFRNNFTGPSFCSMNIHHPDDPWGHVENHNVTRNIFLMQGPFNLDGVARNNNIYHNDFISSSMMIYNPQADRFNNFDKGYPSCGNYWSLHNLTDVKKGKYQNETGSDHIADSPYNVSFNGDGTPHDVDHYPLNITYLAYSDSVLVKYLNLSDVNDDSIVNMRDIAAAIYASGTKPGDAKWNWFADVNGDFRIDNADITWIQQNFNKRFP